MGLRGGGGGHEKKLVLKGGGIQKNIVSKGGHSKNYPKIL